MAMSSHDSTLEAVTETQAGVWIVAGAEQAAGGVLVG